MRLNWKKLSRDERIAIIRSGTAKSMSAQEIADSVDGCTRNSICGLAFKTGIKLYGSKGAKPKYGKSAKTLAWKSMSSIEKAEYVRVRVDAGMSGGEIAASISGATPNAVRNVAKRNGIKMVGNLPIMRKSRFVEKPVKLKAPVVKVRKPKPEKPKAEKPKVDKSRTWKAMSSAERVAFIKKMIAAGKTADALDEIVRSEAESAVQAVEQPDAPYQAVEIVSAPTDALGVNIMDIGSGQCRFPLWEDRPRRPLRSPEDWNFCGDAVKCGSSFCSKHHSRLLYIPERKRSGTAKIYR